MTEKNITVFIHYSWDNESHKRWVLDLSNRLIDDGIDVLLDQYDLKIGSNNLSFMEKINLADKVILVMTEKYKLKATNREGGVGYEYQIIQTEFSNNISNNEKFLPILKEGDRNSSVPVFLQGYSYLNMINENLFEDNYIKLLRNIYNEHELTKPPIGKKPDFTKLNQHEKKNDNSFIIDLRDSKEVVRNKLGNPQQESPLTDVFWNHGIEVYYNKHDDFADGFIVKRLPSGVAFEGEILGVKLGDTFGEVKAKLGNPINWGLPGEHSSLAFYHIDNQFITIAIWREKPEDAPSDFKIGSVYAIGYCLECSVLACEPMSTLAIEDIRQGRKISFLEDDSMNSAIYDIDVTSPFFKEVYHTIPPYIAMMGGYMVTTIFPKSGKIIDFWFYDLGWSYMVIRAISQREMDDLGKDTSDISDVSEYNINQ
jgi:TIR domain